MLLIRRFYIMYIFDTVEILLSSEFCGAEVYRLEVCHSSSLIDGGVGRMHVCT